MGSVIHCLPET